MTPDRNHAVPRARRTRALSTAALTLAIGLIAGCSASVMPEIHSESERLATAQRLYDRNQMVEATELLKGYIQRNAGTAQVDGAILLLGQCLIKQHTWLEAQEQFERLLKDYPESDSAGSASFLLGEALFGQSRPKDFDQQYTLHAIEQWKEYERLYPGHWRNAGAAERIQFAENQFARKLVDTGDLYVKLRLWDPARIYYQRVLDDYPESLPSGDAELGLAAIDARTGKPDLAIDRLKDLEKRFPGRPIAKQAAQLRASIERSMHHKQPS